MKEVVLVSAYIDGDKILNLPIIGIENGRGQILVYVVDIPFLFHNFF